MQNYSGAVAARRAALAAGKPSSAAASAALASDLRGARHYEEALDVVREAQESAPAGVRAVLGALEAELLSCSGDAHAVEALRAFARAQKLAAAAGEGGGGPRDASAAVRELGLLRRALRLEGAAAAPGHVRAGLAMRAQKLATAMLAAGPWRHAQQLPVRFDPALLARPWHDEAAPWPQLRAVGDALRAAAPALLAEYLALRDAGLLVPETECIHEPVWLAAPARPPPSASSRWHPPEAFGAWHVFTANHPAHRPAVDERGYSLHAPAASALVGRIAALALPRVRVLRGGYSALWPGALLHPHYGESNSAVKMHLALTAPTAGPGGAPCAALSVANETRAWVEGQVLFFDDSWLHSVRFLRDGACASSGERVVFQLVLAHPDSALAADSTDSEGGKSAGALLDREL